MTTLSHSGGKVPSKSQLAHQCVLVVLLRPSRPQPLKEKYLYTCTCVINSTQNMLFLRNRIFPAVSGNEDVTVVNDCSPPV